MPFRCVQFGVLASLLLVSPGCGKGSPTAAKPTGAPTITVIQPARSLGLIPLGKRVETFEVANTGAGPLAITQLERSCRCADVDIDRTTLLPGEKTTLTITISPRESEQKTANVTVHSNDQTSPQTRISLDWTARGAVHSETHQLDFGVVRPSIAAHKTLKIERNLTQIPVTCKALFRSSPPGIMQSELKHSEELQGRLEETWEITLLADENFKDHSGRLYLTFEGSDEGGLSLPVSWSMRNVIEAEPKRLFLGVGAPSEKVTRTVELSADQGTVLKVSKIENMDPKLTMVTSDVEVSPELTRIEVQATLPEEPGSYVGKLRVELESPSGTVIEIPVVCVVKKTDKSP